jgi:hypothetical protein
MRISRSLWTLCCTCTLPAMSAPASPAGALKSGGGRRVTVYVWGEENLPFEMRAPALETASAIFAEIGVAIEWRRRHPAESQAQRERASAVRMAGNGGGASRKTLAAARP